MSMTDIQVIEQQGLRVLTTAQLAECYGTDSKIIANNFNRNKERYEEGKHYICLKGAELQEFKTIHQFDEQFKHSAKVYLWTERGALLHAKSLNTDKAWEVYGELVETYFRAQKAQIALQSLSPQTQAIISLEIKQNEIRKDLDNAVQRIEELERKKPESKSRSEQLVPKKADPKPWSEREKDYLRDSFNMGLTDVEIAAQLGRTLCSIHSKRWAMGLIGKGGARWSKDEDKKLTKLYNKGLTYNEIAKILGRSYDGVSGRLAKLRKGEKV